MIENKLTAALQERARMRGADTARFLRGTPRELEVCKLELEIQQDALAEAHARTQASRAYYLDLFEHAPVAYCVLDSDANVLEANRTACDLVGIPRAALLGTPLHRVVDASDLGRFHAFLAAADDSHTRITLRDRTVLVDASTRAGRRLVVMTQIESPGDRGEDPMHSQRLRLLGSSVCTLAHELNNLMQKLGSLFGRIETRTTDVAIQGLVQRGHTTVRYGADLVRRVLRFGRHRPTPRPLPVEIDTWMASTFELLQPIVGTTIELSFDAGANGIQVMCDAGELELAMLNLTANARDAMPTGGRLRVATRVVTTPPASRWVAITVQDTGKGIPLELQQQIFEPFVTTKPLGAGSGIGLATTKTIIESVGGTLDVVSKLDEGTTFRLLLPVFVAPPLRLATRVDQSTPLASAPREILIVEDNAVSRRAMKEHLMSLGYHVSGVARPSRALELASEQPFDACILDIQLPEMTGAQLATELRSLLPQIRILFMSGMPEDMLDLHGAAFLAKPFGLDDVARALEQL